MTKTELLDFLVWFAGNEEMTNESELEQIVDIYLKSINSEHPVEAQTLEEHEVLTEVCNCMEFTECHMINGTFICARCNKPLMQTC